MRRQSLRVGWRNIVFYANYPNFCENHQFHFIYCVTLAYVPYFEEFPIHGSRRFTIYWSIPKLICVVQV